MTPSDTMRYMPAKSIDRPPSPRLLAGQAVKELIGYYGMTVVAAGQVADNLSTPTIRRIIRGDHVGNTPLQAMAGVLHLPVNVFLLMIEGNRKAIEALTMPDYPKEYILSLLDSSGPAPRRRASDG